MSAFSARTRRDQHYQTRTTTHRITSDMDYLGKKYKFSKGDNLEEFFKAVGSKTATTSPAAAAKDFAAPVTELVKNADGTFTLTVGTAAGAMVRTFTPGQEVDEDMWGQQTKSTYTLDANKLTQVQKTPNGKVVTIIREFTPTSMSTINTVDGWDGKCMRYYDAV